MSAWPTQLAQSRSAQIHLRIRRRLIRSPRPDHARRYASDDTQWGYAACHDGSGRDHTSRADAHAVQDDGAGADPDIIRDVHADALLALLPDGAIECVEAVVLGEDSYAWTENDIAAYLDAALAAE